MQNEAPSSPRPQERQTDMERFMLLLDRELNEALRTRSFVERISKCEIGRRALRAYLGV